MSDLSHPADPGFRVILALLRAGIEHRKLGRLLPDWPQELKDTWHREDRAYREAWHGMWDVFCGEFADDAPNPGVDATADTSDAMSVSEPKLKQPDGVSRASEALPPAVVDHIERCGE